MPDFDLTGELSLKIELHMLRPITEKVHSGNGPVSLVTYDRLDVCTNMLSSHLSFDKNQHAGTVPSPRISMVGCEYTQGLPFDK